VLHVVPTSDSTIQKNQDEKESTHCVIPTYETCQRVLISQWAEYRK